MTLVVLGALAGLFVVECLLTYWPWRIVTLTELAMIAANGVLWAVLYTDRKALYALAIAGTTLLVHHAFRLVRAWADRTEGANMGSIVRGHL
jgi:hypothetical protein